MMSIIWFMTAIGEPSSSRLGSGLPTSTFDNYVHTSSSQHQLKISDNAAVGEITSVHISGWKTRALTCRSAASTKTPLPSTTISPVPDLCYCLKRMGVYRNLQYRNSTVGLEEMPIFWPEIKAFGKAFHP
jgi:hypothetical protein